MTTIQFDGNAEKSPQAKDSVSAFLESVATLETKHDMPIIIFQDGASGAYYIKCSLLASDAARLSDLDAKLDLSNRESYRANRQLFLKNFTYKRMESDATKGREFNDIIVEYSTEYNPGNPLKV